MSLMEVKKNLSISIPASHMNQNTFQQTLVLPNPVIKQQNEIDIVRHFIILFRLWMKNRILRTSIMMTMIKNKKKTNNATKQVQCER